MKFTGVLYGRPNEWVIILEGDLFRYQELYKSEKLDWTQGQIYKIFGKQKFKKIVETLKEYEGEIRKFELDAYMLTVTGLWRHATTGKIHESNYDTILWEASDK